MDRAGIAKNFDDDGGGGGGGGGGVGWVRTDTVADFAL